MSKLILNESIKSYLDTDDKLIWDYILEDKIQELLSALPRKDVDKQSAILDKIVGELFSTSESKTLKNHNLATLDEGSSAFLSNMVRLVLVLDINGKYDDLRQLVADKFSAIEPLVEDIQKKSNGYPRNPINGLIWMEASGVRSALNALIYYYQQIENVDAEHFMVVMRTKITLAIMGHYKNLVGPDMIQSAKIKERLGESEIAMAFYEAVRDDFEEELDWFSQNNENGASEDDTVILQSLKEAYLSIDRLNGSDQYTEQCAIIDEILSREYVEEFEEEEEDEA